MVNYISGIPHHLSPLFRYIPVKTHQIRITGEEFYWYHRDLRNGNSGYTCSVRPISELNEQHIIFVNLLRCYIKSSPEQKCRTPQRYITAQIGDPAFQPTISISKFQPNQWNSSPSPTSLTPLSLSLLHLETQPHGVRGKWRGITPNKPSGRPLLVEMRNQLKMAGTPAHSLSQLNHHKVTIIRVWNHHTISDPLFTRHQKSYHWGPFSLQLSMYFWK